MSTTPPINVLPLLAPLHQQLLQLLQGLEPNEWQAATIAGKWTVKDVAAHILDGYLRGLSASRDGHLPPPDQPIDTYPQLLQYLHQLNHGWTDAARRLSPAVLIGLLDWAGPAYHAHLASIPAQAPAIFAVAWAGQQQSPHWFHTAREYTEQFVHQQQIRDAVQRPGLLSGPLFKPFIHTLLLGLPHTFAQVAAPAGTTVQVRVGSQADDDLAWWLQRQEQGWQLYSQLPPHATLAAAVQLPPAVAWKLFSKSWRPAQAMPLAQLEGDETLARQVLELVAVMA